MEKIMSSQSPYAEFAGRMLHPDSKWIPEILKSMIDEQQARLLVTLPGSDEDMAKKLGRTEEDVRRDLSDMFRKGLVFKKTKEGVTKWRPPMNIAQFHDASILWPEAPDSFYDLWQRYMEEEWPRLAAMLGDFMPRPYTRVVPVEQTLDAGRSRILAPESLRQMIGQSSRVAVSRCTCRITMKKCDAPVEVCLQINRGAEYTIERGSGREVSRDEALAIIRQAEEAGLVHVTMNHTGAGTFICNCCGCCCQAFTMLIAQGTRLCDPSRYRPEVNPELCQACGTCADRCWFKAIAVGDGEVSVVSAEACMGCGLCAVGCPNDAIAMIEAKTPDFIPPR
jgi:Pyruvate/2-oxoacid:ferredoxin oxidoreductase delta subunit